MPSIGSIHGIHTHFADLVCNRRDTRVVKTCIPRACGQTKAQNMLGFFLPRDRNSVLVADSIFLTWCSFCPSHCGSGQFNFSTEWLGQAAADQPSSGSDIWLDTLLRAGPLTSSLDAAVHVLSRLAGRPGWLVIISGPFL